MTKSAVCCCHNRNVMLQHSLPTWLQQQSPFDEIVLVDWGGDQRVRDIMGTDERIVLVEVPDATRWILTHAYNLGIAISSGDTVYKLDTDYTLTPRFTHLYGIVTNPKITPYFLAGNWRNHKLNTNECSINGCMIVERTAFNSVGGYNESIVEYGFDDEDLYERLQAAGYTRRDILYGQLRHIKHSHGFRSCGADNGRRCAHIEQNRDMARATPWSPSGDFIKWKVFKFSSRHYVCRIT